MGKIVLITRETLGEGDAELGRRLMGSFLRKLCLNDPLPEEIIFYNTGVKLLAEGSPVLDALERLSKKGVQLTACGTCVAHFGLQRVIEPVRVGDMAGIIGRLMSDARVVTV